MRIITYNVNGLRAALSKGFIDWLKATQADVVCLQETKAQPSQIPTGLFEDLGYTTYWHSAQKKGYSGVAVFTKIKPDKVTYGFEPESGLTDTEGRLLRIDLGDVSVMSLYIPSGSSGQERQDFKMQWLDKFYAYIRFLMPQQPNLLIVGDYNICHQPIDIHNPKSNANSSGFLPEEREWLSRFLELGFVDTFRWMNKEPHQYTWWSFRSKAREKNLGWRIDYQLLSEHLKDSIQRAVILSEAKHSDHCPVMIELDNLVRSKT